MAASNWPPRWPSLARWSAARLSSTSGRTCSLPATKHDDSNVIELRPGSSFTSFSKVPAFDELAVLLRSPTGGAPPEFPDPGRIEHHGLRDRLLADVLNDALDHLELRWE